MKNIDSTRKKHALTPTYILAYLILSEDTWRLGFGVLFAYILGPSILATRHPQIAGTILIYVMLVGIGWWLFGYPSRKLTNGLMGWIRKKSN